MADAQTISGYVSSSIPRDVEFTNQLAERNGNWLTNTKEHETKVAYRNDWVSQWMLLQMKIDDTLRHASGAAAVLAVSLKMTRDEVREASKEPNENKNKR